VIPAAELSPQMAAAELLRRRRARESLAHYALAIDIPGAPVSDDLDEALFRPIESSVALHHRVMMAAIQRTMERFAGRLMIFAPPGSAKSTYTSVVAPTWAIGRWPGSRIILASYASPIARKQSRRARQICMSSRYQSIWQDRPTLMGQAVDDWSLSNGSEYMAAGLLAGITGNRASGAIVDDPVAGREEADSPTTRQKTDDAYRDDLLTRLIPGAWLIIIQTRWHELDLSGGILPEDYDGRSGMIECRDGQVWEILNIPAKCERADDPLGRTIGEYLWPEWFPPEHWQLFENDPRSTRTWSALYQQRPSGEGSGDFDRGWFRWYDPDTPAGHPDGRPERLRYYGASDFAVTAKDANDMTEHGVVGMDEKGDLWVVDWWGDQVTTDLGIERFLDFVEQYRPAEWWDEGGVIDKSIRPAINRRMRERRIFTTLTSLPSMADKRAKCQSFRARASARTVHLPLNRVWAQQIVEQLVGFPAVRFDDKYDVCGLIGRGIDQMADAPGPPAAKKRGVKPFTEEWLMATEDHDRPKIRYR
jgi:predicted phage terminase large subunit-like protein